MLRGALLCRFSLIFHLSEVPSQILTLTHPTYELSVFPWIILNARTKTCIRSSDSTQSTHTYSCRCRIPYSISSPPVGSLGQTPARPSRGFPSCRPRARHWFQPSPERPAALPNSAVLLASSPVPPGPAGHGGGTGDATQGVPPAPQARSCPGGSSPTALGRATSDSAP